MVETDWREILSFSQRELGKTDKEKLCESISWMEADDIELNFSDLKTLFRLSQDILKYKSEQVNNLLGELESVNKKSKKRKFKTPYSGSPASTDSGLETIANQEEIIKANKEILEQLYEDIAELEGKKSKLDKDGKNFERDSDSSRDALSEMDAIVRLENEVSMKNRHIRKLLSDVKVLEDENTKLKEKVTELKDKLLEATQLIDSLTEQLLSINNDCSQLKEIIGKSEKEKSELSCQIELLRKELFEKCSNRENIYDDIKAKVRQWKSVAKAKEAELEVMLKENEQLKHNLSQATQQDLIPEVKNNTQKEQNKIQELQDKLNEASNEMEQSANIITALRAENRHLKNLIEDTPESTLIDRNESDDGKQRILIDKLKKKVKSLTVSLHGAEQMIAVRECELAEIASELQLLQSDEGINNLLQGLKHKKRELKVKDEGIKSLVHEVNNMSQLVDELQLENETLRQKFNVPANKSISTDKIVKKYRDLEQNNSDMCREIRRLENKLVTVELQNHNLNNRIVRIIKVMKLLGYDQTKIEEIVQDTDSDEDTAKTINTERGIQTKQATDIIEKLQEDLNAADTEIKKLAEENEGLRNGLQEILDFLKDNSTTSSGILTLQCPSLETLLTSMEARHSAGWFAPHMVKVLELKAAMGGKDALLSALNDARKETLEVMTQLSKEMEKSSNLESKLQEIENKNKEAAFIKPTTNVISEFGSWMSPREQNNVNINDRVEIENMLKKGNSFYEDQLKKCLEHFHNKFKNIYDKINLMAIQADDDNNKWSIQEEQYIAQIESLKGQIQQQQEDDISESSPGLITIPNVVYLQRKCSYLEDAYKHLRTNNENLKNENMDAKRQIMTISSEYEIEMQRLVLAIANLTDKLRNSVPVELFWKQNSTLNETTLKYRKVVEDNVQNLKSSAGLFQKLDRDKLEILNKFQNRIDQSAKNGQSNTDKVLSNIEEAILKKQLEALCKELENKNKKIDYLEDRNAEIQNVQSKFIDSSLASITKDELNLLTCQLQQCTQEKKVFKEQFHHVRNQLDIALLQLQEYQERQMSHDMEINLLRHQILDLQSSSDNKAIVARLSSEVLVAHLQASENNKRIDQLNSALNREKELRIEAEELSKARQKIFEVYSFRFESKFRYMFEVMQGLRQQYQGSIPLISVENYLNNIEDLSRETHALNEKLQETDDLRLNLMAKHSVFDQILDVSKNKCLTDANSCSHKLKASMMKLVHERELDHMTNKLKTLEQSREDLMTRCNNLEKTLVLVNQGFEKSSLRNFIERKHSVGEISVDLELEDIQSDDESSSRRSQTITLANPQVLKILKAEPKEKASGEKKVTKKPTDDVIESPVKYRTAKEQIKLCNVQIQTMSFERLYTNMATQTINDTDDNNLKEKSSSLQKYKELDEALSIVQKRNKEIIELNSEKINLEANIQHLQKNCSFKDKKIEKLCLDIDELKNELENFKTMHLAAVSKIKETEIAENATLVLALKQLENDKNVIVAEYKGLLNNEREEYSKTIKDLNIKVMELQSKLDRKGSDSSNTNGGDLKDVINKYTVKIIESEDKVFKLQSELDEYKSKLSTYHSEVDRWKDLATERLLKMEQLNSQLEERHCHEVESYKQENKHWLSQLNDTQREHMELRSKLTEQKALYLKQLADRDGQIEHMRSVINNLKTQIINMQTMISVHDPSFDLSAIVEVDEASDGMSHQGSTRLEIKFDSSEDLNMSDEFGRIGSSSTTIWQEPIIERLRRDKQLAGKQNAILRRQIKALAARERKSRLDAQNLKNQVFRISSSGNRVATAESAALQNKIAMLQAQLTSARRDTNSSIALWDKWKRAQQAAERWQSRFEDKCQDVKKLEANVQLAKSTVSRLEREKRVLLSRIVELKGDCQLSIEKQDSESPEKSQRSIECANCMNASALSNQALLERVQAQQRRIAALTLAEKGNEHLVSEYEKALAEITSLKGQVLKLESTLLESQIRLPLMKPSNDTQPELEYLKSYCEMLKEENVQLIMRVNSLESVPTTAHQHRINDLEQTILTLRGLVSKLQSEQKSSTSVIHKKGDSRSSSARSLSEKGQTRLESHRIEIINLKRSIQDKDLLLEKSKEMLKIAAEREDELLRENALLRRQLNEVAKPKEGFLSA